MKIIKKTGLTLLLAASFPLQAAPGFNLGLEIGDALNLVKHNIRDQDPGNASNSISAKGNGNGLNAGISLGYMLDLNSAISANISINANWFTHTTKVTDVNLTDAGQTVNINSKEKLKRSFGIRVQPMFQLHNDTSIFVTLGYRRGYFNASSTDQDIGEATQRRSINDSRNGLEYGAGIATNLTEKMQVTFGVNKTDFKSKQLIGVSDFSLNSKVSVVKVNLGLNWLFS